MEGGEEYDRALYYQEICPGQARARETPGDGFPAGSGFSQNQDGGACGGYLLQIGAVGFKPLLEIFTGFNVILGFCISIDKIQNPVAYLIGGMFTYHVFGDPFCFEKFLSF